MVRQTERSGTALAIYALDRSRRLELAGGVSRLAFDRGVPIADSQREWSVRPAPLMLGTASAALVSDKTVAGVTSALRGERYRFEVAPTFGTIQYASVLADYRRYVTPIPFYTIAARGLYIGRHGGGAGDPRMPPLYLGHPTLIRGYGLNPRMTDECADVVSTLCREVEGMFGSRAAVTNIELRFPILRPFGISRRMYGAIPMEVALFADGGLAWRQRQHRWSSQMAASTGAAWSTGVTLRANVYGLGLGQFDIARTFSGRSGWTFQFNLASAL
jgi:outer membrane protein assembly factor BamA